ncbi:putative bifunctional diguanylate cyclase/phosphodiesterase [Amphibiibacter pelophylacis]|uniref:EAL domain-containing protein n=1 Tax=Amphibiibacter pelophylacis TaxID=1799477 RepID=A0ACC6P2Y5_9BURK
MNSSGKQARASAGHGRWKWAALLAPFFCVMLLQLSLGLVGVQIMDGIRASMSSGSNWFLNQRNAMLTIGSLLGNTLPPSDFQTQFDASMELPMAQIQFMESLQGRDQSMSSSDTRPVTTPYASAVLVRAGSHPDDVQRISWFTRLFRPTGLLVAPLHWWDEAAEITRDTQILARDIQRSLLDDGGMSQADRDAFTDRLSGLRSESGAVSRNLSMSLDTMSRNMAQGLWWTKLGLWLLLVVAGGYIMRRSQQQADTAAQALAKGEERWRLAVESTNDAMWDFNAQTGEWYNTPRWLTMVGLPPDTPVTDGFGLWYSLIHPDDRMTLAKSIEEVQASASNNQFVMQYRLRHTDGNYRHVRTRGTVLSRDGQGMPIRTVGVSTDITQQVLAEESFRHMAHFDALTGLHNRVSFDQSLAAEVKRSERSGKAFTVICLDLDNFKDINDGFGHDVGDQLLIEASRRLRSCLREYDTLARIGSDEFRIIVCHTDDSAHAQPIARKLLDTFAQPFQIGEARLLVTASAGIAAFPSDAKTPAELVVCADQAMYAAKEAGRNVCQMYVPAMQTRARQRRELVLDLREAVRTSQFYLTYQPIVELESGQVTKAEALIRWPHPQRGLISPAEFIPIAEDCNLIGEIGQWLCDQATRDTRLLQRLFGNPFQVSINQSPRQFTAFDGKDGVIDSMTAHGLGAQSVCVEITEGVMMDMNPHVKRRLMAYRDAGIQVSLDDFGTGYSSLAYLKDLDIDYLKIDRAFVQSLRADSSDRALCEAMIVMAHKLGLKVIAEGVETQQQRDLLRNMGCDYGQGYLFSKPLPFGDFQVWLAAQRLQGEDAMA